MKAGELRRVPIEGELTISNAAEHKQRLLSALGGEAGLRLDLSAVSELDTAGLQVLLLVQREAERLSLVVEFCDPSPAAAEVLTITHLSQPEV
ncbi:MAG: STAS domain-containing protein [Actinoplanes sp.]